MKKFYLLFSVLFALCCTLSVNAAKVLVFTENYESGGVSDTKWGSQNLAAGLSISGDEFGKYLQFAVGGNNARSAQCEWGHDIFSQIVGDEYDVTFDVSFAAKGNNQENGEVAIFSDATHAQNNGNYRDKSSNWLFDLSQVGAGNASDAAIAPVYFINGDEADTWTPDLGAWYTINIHVNKATRQVDYSISPLMESPIKQGSYTAPEGTIMDAAGIYLNGARYQSITQFDNVSVSYEAQGDFANDPVVALTGVMNQERTYTISFLEGEQLHVTGTDGTEVHVEYLDCLGSYTYTTSTSGTLTAYTTCGSAESKKVSVEVNASIITLPAATATISNVQPGFGKSYTLTADNSLVELKPTIFFAYEFKGEDGTNLTGSELTNGAVVDLPGKGTLTITTSAYGYGSNTTTIVNNIEYALATDYDFAHMDDAAITGLGFAADGEVTGNYATYGRLYGWDAASYDPEAETNNKIVYGTIPQFTKMSSTWSEAEEYPLWGDLLFTAMPAVNLHIYKGVGFVTEGRKGDAMDGNWIQTTGLKVKGLTDNDFIVVYSMNNYGSNSLHPIVADLDAYLKEYNAPATGVYKGTEEFTFTRISDLIARVVVYKPANGGTGINEIINSVENADAPVYDLRGMRVNKASLKKGVYIQNGKKFVVK